jgi:hypothetical protein
MPEQVRMVVSFTPLTDMIGGSPFNLRPGHLTDDVSISRRDLLYLERSKGAD